MEYTPNPTVVTTSKGLYNTNTDRRKYFGKARKRKKMTSVNGIPIVRRRRG